jgi:hypothetical protein
MEKKLITAGKDYREMYSIFRDVVLKCGIENGDNVIWGGCPGSCYAMASFLSYGLRDLGLNLYFAVDADIHNLWRLELMKEVGIYASKKEKPIKAKVLVLMSGLLRVPFENVLQFVRQGLGNEGTIIGETAAPGLFEQAKWHERIPFKFIFEFSMERPSSFEVVSLSYTAVR